MRDFSKMPDNLIVSRNSQETRKLVFVGVEGW